MMQHAFHHQFLRALLATHPSVRQRLEALPLKPNAAAPLEPSRQAILQRWLATLADVRISDAVAAQRQLTETQQADLEGLATNVRAIAIVEGSKPRRRRGQPAGARQ
jgi:hypothetical protein